ncbi:MAG: GNAT family N-acetyltransferase [Planctomycetota bacterium]
MIDPCPSHGRYRLRPVRDEDESWMWSAGQEALRRYVVPIFGDDEAAMRGFFDRSWRNRLAVEVDGENAGWLEFALERTSLHLHDIGLLRAFRGRGLGGCILEDVCRYADEHQLDLELQVLINNPAQRLYERMGLRPTHYKMFRPRGGWTHEPPREPAD